LNKPGPLTNAEWEIMRSHSERSARILERIPSLHDLAPIVRAHHERFDGMGYPDRLTGNAIPLAARIVAVADSFNAMISKRPYREAMSVTQAINALMDGRGRQWDSAVVDVMLTVVKPHMIAQAKRVSEAM
jgi:HD-GYP domain-containing protein (c-di-GMP phosphodiesterase class II)